MGRSLAELLETYLLEEDLPPETRAPAPEQREVLERALGLAAAVAPLSVVGVAFSPAGGITIVRLGGIADIDRSLALADRLADEAGRGLASAAAEHLILRVGDRLRLGADRGAGLDADQRSLLEGVALLTARAVARSGAVPLGSTARHAAPPGARREGTSNAGPGEGDPSSDIEVEVA